MRTEWKQKQEEPGETNRPLAWYTDARKTSYKRGVKGRLGTYPDEFPRKNFL